VYILITARVTPQNVQVFHTFTECSVIPIDAASYLRTESSMTPL